MLDHPKWLLFAVFTFGLIHTLGYLIETGTIGAPIEPSGGFGLSFGSVIWNIVSFDYNWMSGGLVYLEFVLVILQWTFLVLVGRDIIRMIRGV